MLTKKNNTKQNKFNLKIDAKKVSGLDIIILKCFYFKFFKTR